MGEIFAWIHLKLAKCALWYKYSKIKAKISTPLINENKHSNRYFIEKKIVMKYGPLINLAGLSCVVTDGSCQNYQISFF